MSKVLFVPEDKSNVINKIRPCLFKHDDIEFNGFVIDTTKFKLYLGSKRYSDFVDADKYHAYHSIAILNGLSKKQFDGSTLLSVTKIDKPTIEPIWGDNDKLKPRKLGGELIFSVETTVGLFEIYVFNYYNNLSYETDFIFKIEQVLFSCNL